MTIEINDILAATKYLENIGVNFVDASIYIVVFIMVYSLFKYISNNLNNVKTIENQDRFEIIDILTELEYIFLNKRHLEMNNAIREKVNLLGKLTGKEEYLLFKKKLIFSKLEITDNELKEALELIEKSKQSLMSKSFNHLNSSNSIITDIENSLRRSSLSILFSSLMYSFTITFGTLFLVSLSFVMNEKSPVDQIVILLILFTVYIMILTTLFSFDKFSEIILSNMKQIGIKYLLNIVILIIALIFIVSFSNGTTEIVLLSLNFCIYLYIYKKIIKEIKDVA